MFSKFTSISLKTVHWISHYFYIFITGCNFNTLWYNINKTLYYKRLIVYFFFIKLLMTPFNHLTAILFVWKYELWMQKCVALGRCLSIKYVTYDRCPYEHTRKNVYAVRIKTSVTHLLGSEKPLKSTFSLWFKWF